MNESSDEPGGGQDVDIHRLLQTMVDKGASDLHLTQESPPTLRINGELYPLRAPPLTSRQIEQIAYSVLNERQKKRFEEHNEIDLSFRWKGSSRFRANFFCQKGAVAGAMRKIPTDTIPIEQLGHPESVQKLVNKPNGLVLVTGATGSGKSTTLASLVDAVNTNQRKHILTIEEPVEFVHNHKRSLVNQREVGSDTESFPVGLRYALRQDPDVVLVGEIRDVESMASTLRIAETGHLAFATLHTNNAIQTIHRMLDFFPPEQQDMVRTQISFVLAGVISQQLVPRKDGRGRVLASEVLLPTDAIRNLIREDKGHQIYSQMQMGQGHHGMQTLNQSLLAHVQSGALDEETALSRAYDAEELEQMIQNARAERVSSAKQGSTSQSSQQKSGRGFFRR